MGNCLKTQLKESVNNSNLAEFGKLRINLKKIINADEGLRWFFVGTKGNPLTVTFYNTDTVGEETVRTIIVREEFKTSVLPTLNNDNEYIIIDNVYDISYLFVRSSEKYIEGSSLLYAQNLIFTNITTEDMRHMFSGLKGIYTNYNDEKLMSIIENNISTLKVITNTSYINMDLSNSIVDNINMFSGTAQQLPYTISRFNCVGGSLTQLVNRFRNNYRTSGKVTMVYMAESTSTIDVGDGSGEQTVKNYCANHGIDISTPYIYLAWDANSISITTDGTGADPYSTWDRNNFL